jgi:type I restriction enzyme S subunit
MAFSIPITELIERNGNGLLGKHESWERVRIGDVATVQNGAAFRSAYFNTEGRGMPLLRIRDVTRGETDTWYDGPYEEEYIVEPGELVIGMDGDFNHSLWGGPPALLNQRVCRLAFDSDRMLKRFVLYSLGGYLQAVNDATSSVTVKHLSSTTVADLLLPLPPRAEQDRIVEALSCQLQRVEVARESLEQTLIRLGLYRAACLSTAFAVPEADAATRLAPLEAISTIQSGLTKSRPRRGELLELPYIRTANVQAGYVDLAQIKTIPVTEGQRRKHQLHRGDVLVLEGGDADKVGRGWIWDGEIEECLHQNHVFAVRPKAASLMPRYLAYFINAPQARTYFLSCAKQTTNLASINKKQLQALPVPMPSLTEQQAAVERLDRQLDGARRYEAELRSQLSRTDALRQSLLNQAFAGRLVPQASSDEPASELLARIKAERSERAERGVKRPNRRGKQQKTRSLVRMEG